MPKTILVVANKDYPATAVDCNEILRRRYNISTMYDPAKALDTISGQGPIDLLIADFNLVMTMDGEQLIEEAHKHRPDLPAILVASIGQSPPVLRPALDKIRER